MALTTAGLTNGGLTTHYQFQYDDSLSGAGLPEPARTNQVIAACENDFNLMSGWFGNIALTVGIPITVNVGPGPYASAGWGPPITLTPGNGSNSILCRYLLVSEVTEMFMLAQNRGWFAPDKSNEGSAGEGLSRFLASQFLISIGQPPAMAGFDLANSWMNSPRQDFVNHIDTGDHGIDAKTGCAILFIYYLFVQLGFTINQMIAAAASELSGVYATLTGDSSDPFPFFKQLLDTAFPGTQTIGGANSDNPYPLGILSFWVDKSTFGVDEVTDVISSPSHGTFPNAFWLILEGFNRNTFNSLGVGAPTFAGPFGALPGLTISQDTSGVKFESADTKIPQRIRFPFDVQFGNATLAAFPVAPNPPAEVTLAATANAGGNPLPGAMAITEFELIAGADPYYTNIDPAQNNVFYLSQDVRVFTATPSLNQTPVPGAPPFSTDTFEGAYSYIQSLLAFLNDPSHHFTDGTNDPFASGVIPNQAGSLTNDSSVSRFTQSGFPIPQLHQNYNFAIARVRLKGQAGHGGEAENVKVFFRVWGTSTADTGFDPTSTYLSHQDGVGHPTWPLPAPDSHTIPFFATGNSPNFSDPNNLEYGAIAVNNRAIRISAGDTAWAYFGCFLNVYDPSNMVNGLQVQAQMPGTHHCLVAEIADDDAPIVNANGVVATPENSDKLAQRNLQLTFSDNPGPDATHRVPQTFDLRPGPAIGSIAGSLLDYPDELMIDWGQTPPGAIAHIYWPQVGASRVLDLAGRLYGAHLLSASDSHTVDCSVTRGVSYVPIPPGGVANLAGLLTVDLPRTVTVGQEFNIVVRRVATRRVKQFIPIQNLPGVEAGLVTNENARQTGAGKIEPPARNEIPPMRNWRYVTGTFQVKIPVTTPEVMLRPDEDALAVMKWRVQLMARSNRWYPVLQRYIEYVSARITGLGGDPNLIPPSPDGAPVQVGPEVLTYTGKVIEVIYDCFGHLEGFVLRDCENLHTFKTRQREIGEIALRAGQNGILLSVYVKQGKEPTIRKLVLKC